MTPHELRDVLEQLDFKPSRKLGQNFLIDGNTLRRLADEAHIEDGDLVVEVGPGTGALTEVLLQRGVDLKAVEYDVRLAEFLRKKFGSCDNFELFQADAARFDFDGLTAGRTWCCSANLPYSVSTVILGNMLDLVNPPKSMTLLLQKEMADRIAAAPGTKVYGAMSVRVQTLYKSKVVKTVPPTVFWPKPDVDSGILTLTLLEDRPSPGLWKVTDRVIRNCFAQRRKKVIKLLRGNYPNIDHAKIFEELGISVDARAEQLNVEQFSELARLIAQASGAA